MEKKMKRIAIPAILMVVFIVVSAFGQTQTEIEAKFGPPVNAYKVGERIWMTPEYASDGQVCRMIFYPRRFSSTTNYLTSQLPFDEFKERSRPNCSSCYTRHPKGTVWKRYLERRWWGALGQLCL